MILADRNKKKIAYAVFVFWKVSMIFNRTIPNRSMDAPTITNIKAVVGTALLQFLF